jgi:UDP-N-acetylmuramate--alanine ligase
MKISTLKKLYFLGIGGIGMSAIARFFLRSGVEIYGYDIASTRLTKKLEAEGMKIHYDIDIDKIPKDIDGVIYTPAIPKDHDELIWLKSNNYSLKKRAEVLGLLSEEMKCIAIAGTHGKTTTSSILSHILTYCGLDISAFVGGILVDQKSNFIYGNSNIVVLEADEYDRSFLHLHPEMLVILSVDPDHLDIYGDASELHKTYEQLTCQIRDGGSLFLMGDFEYAFSDKWMQTMQEKGIEIHYLNKSFSFSNIRVENERYVFDFKNEKMEINEIVSQLPGKHNISNTSVAIQIALNLGVKPIKIQNAIMHFKGIHRRFEILYDQDKVLVDDYAHHPEELRYAVETINTLYPHRKVLGIFQPHLFSRTSDFYKGFAKQLQNLDEVWILEIYPARELPINGVKSELIYNLIPSDNKRLLHSSELLSALNEKEDLDVVITIGASDIDKYHEEIIKILKK